MKKKILLFLLIGLIFCMLLLIISGCKPKNYTIIWQNYDGDILETDYNVEEGLFPSYDGDTPTKIGNAEFSYEFSGWSPEINPTTSDITYIAQYREIKNKYTITWQNYDGTILEIDENVEYGLLPNYDGETPQREKDIQYTYSFSRWAPMIDIVTSDTIYVANFYTKTRKDAFIGEGTKENPYVIESIYNLLFLEEEVNIRNQQYSGEYFIQTKDIDMMGYSWTPLGHSEKTAFKGNYNGCGKTIQNINIKVSNNGYVGFFGYCQNGIIENISLKAITIECYIGKNISNAGLLVGYGDQCNLLNCKTEGSIYIESYKAQASIGGVIGSAFFCYPYDTHKRIVSCESVVTIVSNSPLPNIGGIAGRVTSYDLSDCVAKTIIIYNEIMSYTGGGTGGIYNGIGGLVGVNLNGTINNSSIELETYSISNVKIGAIAGLSDDGKIEDCNATINSISINIELSIVAFDRNKEKPKNCNYILKEN